jgi:hypothetical protein
MHDDLTKMCLEFINSIPAEIRFEPSSKTTYNAVLQRFFYDHDFTVGMDEDVFILNPQELWKTIDYMQRNGYAYAGMPESGVSSIRLHDPKYTNSFFTIQNMELIRPYQDELSKVDKMKYATRGEMYWSIYEFLDSKGLKRLELKGNDHPDDHITTVIKGVGGKDMLYHTWFARLWRTHDNTEVMNNDERIYKMFLEAKLRRDTNA